MEVSDDKNDLIDLNLINHWKRLKHKPKVIVFDLDYTLWPFYADLHLWPPIRKNNSIDGNIEIIDQQGMKWMAFKDVTKILKTLKEHCLESNQYLAIASRSTTNELARNAIDLFGWTSYFSSIQIYPKSKLIHMKEIMTDLNVGKYQEILFFDDETHTNIIPTRKVGITACEIDPTNGLTMNDLIDGLYKFNERGKNVSN